MMCHMERRHGHMKPVIKKALVELDGEPFKCFAAQRSSWAKYDLYRSPGPIQFFSGESTVELSITLTLELLKSDPRMAVDDLNGAIAIEDRSTDMGGHLHAPLVGSANKVHSDLQKQRTQYKPKLCPALRDGHPSFSRCIATQPTQCMNSFDKDLLRNLLPRTYGSPLVGIEHVEGALGASGDFTFEKKARTSRGSSSRQRAEDPLTIGVVFCGRQAPGGHDFIAGVLDSLPQGSVLHGFVGGTEGLFAGHSIRITEDVMANYRGQGGFELLGRSVDKIKSEDQYRAVAQVNC
jgi:hypothetical protein